VHEDNNINMTHREGAATGPTTQTDLQTNNIPEAST